MKELIETGPVVGITSITIPIDVVSRKRVEFDIYGNGGGYEIYCRRYADFGYLVHECLRKKTKIALEKRNMFICFQELQQNLKRKLFKMNKSFRWFYNEIESLTSFLNKNYKFQKFHKYEYISLIDIKSPSISIVYKDGFVEILEFKESIISLLENKKIFLELVDIFKFMTKHNQNDKIDLEDYIDDWAKKLLNQPIKLD